ncbi:hypothetical protein MNV49_002160 [Pseudohyphozyma bogoriensis]|nr:hypothetical protein MNV49_002160 [Pseudohyphozyma bogoriensis]
MSHSRGGQTSDASAAMATDVATSVMASDTAATASAASSHGHGGTSVMDATSTAVAAAASASSTSASGHGKGDSGTTSSSNSTVTTTTTTNGHGGNTSNGHGHGGHGGGDMTYDWMWTAICGLVILFAIRNLVGKFQTRRRKAALVKSGGAGAGAGVLKTQSQGSIGALSTSARNGFIATSFPSWLYGPETVADACWTMAYFGATLAVTFWSAPWSSGNSQNLANKFGDLAFVQAPLIMFFIMKNNPISLLTGVAYVKLNYLHRAGWVAMGAYQFLWMSSFAIVRRVLHQFFLTSHIVLTILYLVGAYYHWGRLGYWIYACFVIWGFDRLVRFGRILYFNRVWSSGRGECTVEVLEGECLRLTAVRPGFKWNAGQHVFLSTPRLSLGPVEAHPFTIANMPNGANEIVLLPRVYNGWTRQMHKQLTSTSTKTIRCYFDGPYGVVHDFTSFQRVLMVAGGTGVSPWTSQLLHLVASRRTLSAPTHIRLVWLVKDASSLEWISPILEDVAESLTAPGCNITVRVDVHVTRGALPSNLSRTSSSTGSGSEKEAEKTPVGSESELAGIPVLEKGAARDSSSLMSERVGGMVTWSKGRPDLAKVIREEAEQTTLEMALGVCGPRGLVITTNQALKQASTGADAKRGQAPIHYFPETLGQ